MPISHASHTAMIKNTQENSGKTSYAADDLCQLLNELVVHNFSDDAHEDIARRFSNITGPSLTKEQIEDAFAEHELSASSHPALKERITTTAYLLYLLAEEFIKTHNDNVLAHPDLRSAIDAAFKLHESSPTTHRALVDLIKAAESFIRVTTIEPITGGGDLSGDRTVSAKYATEISFGIVQRATTIEVSLGKDDKKYTTSKHLGDFLLSRSVIPRGSILWWHGAPQDLPEGYIICDGKNGTPDLRNLRYLVGAGKTYSAGDLKPGNKSSTVVVGAATLTWDQMPSHQHAPPNMGEMTKYANYPYGGYGAYISGSKSSGGGVPYPWLQPIGGNGSHTHAAYLASAVPDPSFRALYVIKKI